MGQKLLDNETGGPDVIVWSAPYAIPDGGRRTLFVWGAFADADVLVEFSPDEEEWFSANTFDIKTYLPLDLAPGVLVHVGVRGASAGTRISAEIC